MIDEMKLVIHAFIAIANIVIFMRNWHKHALWLSGLILQSIIGINVFSLTSEIICA